ncbi:MAG: hypothetical protein P4M11_10290 [Candidatus Pacebacteria bacterium]|nr:hypothetical protein [Candidatus Paceibacterota bacterium]
MRNKASKPKAKTKLLRLLTTTIQQLPQSLDSMRSHVSNRTVTAFAIEEQAPIHTERSPSSEEVLPESARLFLNEPIIFEYARRHSPVSMPALTSLLNNQDGKQNM